VEHERVGRIPTGPGDPIGDGASESDVGVGAHGTTVELHVDVKSRVDDDGTVSRPTAALTIGEVAERTGVATSALRYYEQQGLIASQRTSGNQRRYQREVLRRVAFIKVAQTVGLDLDEIAAALATLPAGRAPTKADWERISRACRPLLDDRIDQLTRLRGELTECIGCGCLSLRACALYNPSDRAGRRGAGPRYLLGDDPREVMATLPTRRR
jgi:MerR family redox-sensitive transcriptional activator SoxR